jgi:thiol-disulfide isomerase/thioredoxin
MNCRLVLAMGLIGAGLTMSSQPLHAQEIQWRPDYAQARLEAAKSYKPLLLDFGTEQCVWCKKLDATTFRDPNVIRLLNEKYIPVKIDGNRDAQLVQSLKIQSYPTLVFAAPDGHILGMNPGYMDANSMAKMLEQATSRIPPKPVPSSLQVAATTPNPAPTGPVNIPSPSALGLQAPNLATTPASPVSDLLRQAKMDLQQGCLMGSLERCRKIVREFPSYPEASEARMILQRLTREPELANRLGKELSDQLGEVLLARADIFELAGRPNDSIACLEYLIRACPDTTWSNAAQMRLNSITGQRPTNNLQMVPVSGQGR